MKMAVTVLGRIGFGFWLAFVAVLAFFSMVANPSPFILMAFAIGGLPAWVVIHRHEFRLVAAASIGIIVTAVPVLMLVGYGVDEGACRPSVRCRWPSCSPPIASTLAWFGMMLGRLVWLPWE